MTSCRGGWLGGFLSTLPARGATNSQLIFRQPVEISIHAPREGSDVSRSMVASRSLEFLSTLPARGATRLPVQQDRATRSFLSTLPARGAT